MVAEWRDFHAVRPLYHAARRAVQSIQSHIIGSPQFLSYLIFADKCGRPAVTRRHSSHSHPPASPTPSSPMRNIHAPLNSPVFSYSQRVTHKHASSRHHHRAVPEELLLLRPVLGEGEVVGVEPGVSPYIASPSFWIVAGIGVRSAASHRHRHRQLHPRRHGCLVES